VGLREGFQRLLAASSVLLGTAREKKFFGGLKREQNPPMTLEISEGMPYKEPGV